MFAGTARKSRTSGAIANVGLLRFLSSSDAHRCSMAFMPHTYSWKKLGITRTRAFSAHRSTAAGKIIRSRNRWKMSWISSTKRSRYRCGTGTNNEKPTCVRPTRDDAWMYSAMSDGMPAKNIALNSSTSTPCEMAEVAMTDRRVLFSSGNGLLMPTRVSARRTMSWMSAADTAPEMSSELKAWSV